MAVVVGKPMAAALAFLIISHLLTQTPEASYMMIFWVGKGFGRVGVAAVVGKAVTVETALAVLHFPLPIQGQTSFQKAVLSQSSLRQLSKQQDQGLLQTEPNSLHMHAPFGPQPDSDD